MMVALGAAEIERLAARSWPAAETAPLAGWQLRYTPGATGRRLNSVLPVGPVAPYPIDDALHLAADFYHQRLQPLRLQVGPAAAAHGLERALIERSFQLEVETDLLVAGAREVLDVLPAPAPFTVVESDSVTPSWFAAYWAVNRRPEDEIAAARGLFARIETPAHFVQVFDGERSIAIGLGVLQGDWLGIFSLATDPDYRRHGACRLVIRTLVEWALERGARSLFLQVLANNAPAQALYRRLGFHDLYRSRYWIEPVI
ncbi:MAG TPA: GNAT family N-acetyltransferase [Limnochordia bacterium]|nr:GNAT family N-acetyltransferase [Limnochordia bacterium]